MQAAADQDRNLAASRSAALDRRDDGVDFVHVDERLLVRRAV